MSFRFLCLILLPTVLFLSLKDVYAQTDPQIDFIQVIAQDTSTANSVGLKKLNVEERKKLNQVLNSIYQLGIKEGSKPTTGSTGSPSSGDKAYKTRIESAEGDLLKLENGAIIEISSGYLGYVGYRKQAVLLNIGRQWKVWIEGKKVYKCELLRSSQRSSGSTVKSVYISEVRGGGSMLIMLDGSIYEVNNLYTITTGLWIGMSEAIIMDGTELLNLDEGDEFVEVTRIK